MFKFILQTHPLDYKIRNTGLEYAKPITIGENVWVEEVLLFVQVLLLEIIL